MLDEVIETLFILPSLTAEGESSMASGAVADTTVSALATSDLGPRLFTIAAPSGTDYRFVIDREGV